MSIVARCKAAARLPTRRGRRRPWRSSRHRLAISALSACGRRALQCLRPPRPRARRARPSPARLAALQQEASSSAPVTETTWPAHHQLQVTHVLGSTRRRRNSAPAVTSPLSRSCSWSVRRRLDMSEAAPDCSPTAMADGRVAPTGMPAVDGLLRAGGSSRRDATLRRTSSSPASPATARRAAADEAAATAAALRELAIGERPRRRGVGRGSVAANDGRRRGRAAAARACVVRLINHYKFFGLMLKPVTGPWGAGPS